MGLLGNQGANFEVSVKDLNSGPYTYPISQNGHRSSIPNVNSLSTEISFVYLGFILWGEWEVWPSNGTVLIGLLYQCAQHHLNYLGAIYVHFKAMAGMLKHTKGIIVCVCGGGAFVLFPTSWGGSGESVCSPCFNEWRHLGFGILNLEFECVHMR